jgi:hypothetical protein
MGARGTGTSRGVQGAGPALRDKYGIDVVTASGPDGLVVTAGSRSHGFGEPFGSVEFETGRARMLDPQAQIAPRR